MVALVKSPSPTGGVPCYDPPGLAQDTRRVVSFKRSGTEHGATTIPTANAEESHMTEAVTQLEIDQRVFDLYDEYCHGRIDRRQ